MVVDESAALATAGVAIEDIVITFKGKFRAQAVSQPAVQAGMR